MRGAEFFGGVLLRSESAGEVRAGLWRAVFGENALVSLGDCLGGAGVALGLHRGCGALRLKPREQAGALRICMPCGVASCAALPCPEVRPLLPRAVCGASAAGGRLDSEQIREERLGLVSRARGAVRLGEHDRAVGAAEALEEPPCGAARLEPELDLGRSAVDAGHHAALRFAADFCPQEKRVMGRLDQGAFSRLVRPSDQCPRRIELH